MVSETVDPIDWSYSPPSRAVPPERLVHSINWCRLSSTGDRPCNFSMRGNHLACAVTQGGVVIILCCNHITRFWVAHARSWRTATDYPILQQELLAPHELREPKHRSGLAPIVKKVRLYTLSGGIGKVVAAAGARSIRAEVALIYTMDEALRGYCQWRWGVRPVNWIYRLWGHCP